MRSLSNPHGIDLQILLLDHVSWILGCCVHRNPERLHPSHRYILELHQRVPLGTSRNLPVGSVHRNHHLFLLHLQPGHLLRTPCEQRIRSRSYRLRLHASNCTYGTAPALQIPHACVYKLLVAWTFRNLQHCFHQSCAEERIRLRNCILADPLFLLHHLQILPPQNPRNRV